MAQPARKIELTEPPVRPVMNFVVPSGVDRTLHLKRQLREFDWGATNWAIKLQGVIHSERKILASLGDERELLRVFYSAIYSSCTAMRSAAEAGKLRNAEMLAEMDSRTEEAPPTHRGSLRRLLREFTTVLNRMDRVSDNFIKSREKIANEAYVIAHRSSDVTLGREQHSRKARLMHSVDQNGWHRFNSPDVVGLNAGGPTLEAAKRDALSTLDFIARHRGASTPEAVFVERESSEA